MGFFSIFKSDPREPGAAAPVSAASAPDGEDCLVCGQALAALATPQAKACALCGETAPAGARCAAGHQVCGACRDGPAGALVERTCAATAERDPVALATRLLARPALVREKGLPHLLVPAVLAAAWANAARRGDRAARVAEAARRAGALPPEARTPARGSGAAAGAGAFAALVLGGAGAAGEAAAAKLEARALALIGGETRRCSKRDALLAILAATKFTREELGADLPAQGIGCETSGRSRECKGAGCPFNR